MFQRLGLDRSVPLDRHVLESLLEMAPPGLDEVFALDSILDGPGEHDVLVVDTAPTGHFLRLLEMPATALAWSRPLVGVLIVLNLAYAAGVALMFVVSLVPGTILWRALRMLPFPAGHEGEIILGLRTVMVLGIVAALMVDRVLRLLRDIVDTVRAGEPFAASNAARLERIAWWVLAGEGLRLAMWSVAEATTTSMPNLEMDFNFSVAPWLAVLLLFVLARVFAEGTRMRSDLDGTV